MKEDLQNGKSTTAAAAKWTKRLGFGAFMFFLIKGLIWLALFIGAAYFGYDFLK